MKKIDTGLVNIIASKVPKGFVMMEIDRSVKHGVAFLNFPEERDWLPVGITDNLTEEEYREFMPHENGRVHGFSYEMFNDWTDPNGYVDTARESFETLLTANGLDPKDNYFLAKKSYDKN